MLQSLKPIDIVEPTAGASGDITGAMKTLPGAQQIGETEGLFVRGGDAGETKTIIDEMVVENPYYSSIPRCSSTWQVLTFPFYGNCFQYRGIFRNVWTGFIIYACFERTDDLAAQRQVQG